MADVPKKQQEYFNRIKKALASGDEQEYADLMRNKNPLAIREDLSNVLGQHVLENYDEPLSVFEDKKILENVPTEYTKMPKGVAGQYDLSTGGVLMPKANPDLINKQTGVKLHEFGHKKDILKGFDASEAFDPKLLKTLGAEAADEAFAKHHKGGFFEKEAIMKLLRNKKLSALAPLLKAAGPAAAIYGMSQGDVFAADPTGMLQTDELGKGSDITEMPSEAKETNRRFKKIRQTLGVE